MDPCDPPLCTALERTRSDGVHSPKDLLYQISILTRKGHGLVVSPKDYSTKYRYFWIDNLFCCESNCYVELGTGQKILLGGARIMEERVVLVNI
jgi:hypothetical protein